ncbi:DUF3775 domain-containing protein [Legionella londiniensis]|uniref:DUF3775 domain-containing protein n=1 Tax=Legionella londiniensis TaxID=45068 RepID=UPI00399CA7C2
MTNVNALSINPDIVCLLILRAREFHAKEEVSIPEDSPDTEYEYDWAQVLADHQDDLTYLEIKNAIGSLEPSLQTELLALMYLGRGDFDDWQAAKDAARDNMPVNFVDYLLAHPFLPDYLEKGLDMLNILCDDFELKSG